MTTFPTARGDRGHRWRINHAHKAIAQRPQAVRGRLESYGGMQCLQPVGKHGFHRVSADWKILYHQALHGSKRPKRRRTTFDRPKFWQGRRGASFGEPEAASPDIHKRRRGYGTVSS